MLVLRSLCLHDLGSQGARKLSHAHTHTHKPKWFCSPRNQQPILPRLAA